MDDAESAGGRSTVNDHYGFYQNQDKIIERNVSSEDSYISETDLDMRSTVNSNYEYP